MLKCRACRFIVEPTEDQKAKYPKAHGMCGLMVNIKRRRLYRFYSDEACYRFEPRLEVE